MLLHEAPLPKVSEPSFKATFQAPFETVRGKWQHSTEGVVSVTDIPEEKHIPVLFHNAQLDEAFFELEFRFEKPGTLIVGCDSQKHIGRVLVTSTGLTIQEDSNEKSTNVAHLPFVVELGKWHRFKASWAGDKFAGILDGKELKARHPYFVAKRLRSWIAASDLVQIRNLKIYGKSSEPKP